jgi:hypothetical protein
MCLAFPGGNITFDGGGGTFKKRDTLNYSSKAAPVRFGYIQQQASTSFTAVVYGNTVKETAV